MSDLWLPPSCRQRPPTQRELYDAYHDRHTHCPVCHESNYEQTCVGYVMDDLQ